MKNGLVISDSGPIFSLGILNKIEILDSLFEEIYILNAILVKHDEEEIKI
jgi:predicted nucleic acid-binding protein